MNKKVIHTVFENIVRTNADRIAIETDTFQLTYQDLNAQANKVAHLLLNRGVEKGDIVATFCESASLQFASLLGVFKSGSIYVPLSKKYKQNHWSVLFEKVQPKIAIVTEDNLGLLHKFSALFSYTIPEIIVVSTDDEKELNFSLWSDNDGVYIEDNKIVTLSVVNPELAIEGDDSNYIFFTSGSTGKPKAVLGNHKSLSHFIHWETKELGVTSSDRIGQLTSSSFDASLRDVFLPLINGGTICVPSETVKNDAHLLCQWMADSQITILHTIPTMMRFLMATQAQNQTAEDYYPRLRYLLLAGEKLYKRDIFEWRKAFGANTCIINIYGATESTLVKTFYRIEEELTGAPSETISVGKAISNTNILILNEQNEICEIGEVGDIFIQTPFLSKGYFKDELLTQEKFIQNPLSTQPETIYRTGDYGKYDSDRNISLSGRKDGLIKLNGVRCDINSVEANILEVPQVDQVKCMPYDVDGREQALVCFYSSNKDITRAIKKHCLGYLSDYEMFSMRFIRLDQFPVNPHGKIDTAVLTQKMRSFFLKTKKIISPTTPTEGELLLIWKEVLGVAKISIADNLFSLGGNSIQITQISARIFQKFNVELSIYDIYNYPVLRDQAEKISTSNKSSYKDIPTVDKQDGYPLSSSQNRLWVLSQFDVESSAYNMPNSIDLFDVSDISLLEKAIFAVMDRHEILRTVFREDANGNVTQWIYDRDELEFQLNYKDFRSQETAKAAAHDFIQKDAYQPFDLANGPLIRTYLLQVSEAHFIFYYNMHHIISDGWSMEIISRDLMAFYNSFQNHTIPALTNLKIQYKDYASWQLKQLTSESFQKHKEYWLQSLPEAPLLIDLPAQKPRPAIKTHNGRSLGTYISEETSQALKAFCKDREGSLFTGLLSGLSALLHRYTSQTDFMFGTPVAGRDHVNLEDQIGFYVNTLVLRAQLSPEDRFEEMFARVNKTTFEAYEHQQYPFDRLVEDRGFEQDLSRSPLFDIMIRLHNMMDTSVQEEIAEEAIHQIEDLGAEASKFDLDFSFQEVGNVLSLKVNFNEDVYSKDMVERLICHYKQLLANVVQSPTIKLGEINYLSTKDEERLLLDFDGMELAATPGMTMVDYFCNQAQKTPEAIAIVYGDKEFTYNQIDQQSTALANYLVAHHHVQIEDLVAVQLERTENLVIAILAVLKSGAAYVPIDTTYPEERIQYILEDSKCNVVINEEFWRCFSQQKVTVTFNKVPVQPENLAYVIYTSGSTGRPKGVMIEHRNATALIQWSQYEFQNLDFEILYAGTSHCFDLSVFEMFYPLSIGSKLRVLKNGLEIPEYLSRDRKVLINTVPSVIRHLLAYKENIENVTAINMAGEIIPLDIYNELANYELEIRNLYGPSEDTTYSSCYLLNGDHGLSIPIGKPISNTTMYVLSENMQLQAIGVTGELFISGDGLARGYFNRTELTSNKFIDNPFKKGQKLYQTGDLVRWMDDGNLEFIGRKDNQVKIRGHRIELGEIETFLIEKLEVEAAVVTACENVDSQKELVAYIVLKEEVSNAVLRTYLLERLPSYMVPNYFIKLESFPFLHNGKIDKSRLPKITEAHKVVTQYVAAVSAEQKAIIEASEQVLGLERIGVKDNFYNLGGDSIKLIQLISKLRSKGYSLRAKDALNAVDMDGMASMLVNSVLSIPQEEVLGATQLLPIQTQFLHHSKISNLGHYNQSIILKSDTEVDTGILQKCIDALVAHHDALRMTFVKEKVWLQYGNSIKDTRVSVDFFELRETENCEEVIGEIGNDLQASIDLQTGPLVKAAHFRLSSGDRLALIIHHLVVDGVSWRILLEDLNTLYGQAVAGKSLKLPLKTHSYKHWSSLLKAFGEELKVSVENDYWKEISKETLPIIKTQNTENLTEINSAVAFLLNKELTETLATKIQSDFDISLDEFLLSCLGISLKEVFEVDKVALKMEGHGREDLFDEVDISRTVGWFTSMYPFILDSRANNYIENLAKVKSDFNKIPNKGIGYGILKNISKTLDREVTPTVSYNYLGDFGGNKKVEKEATFNFSSEYIGDEVSENYSDVLLRVSGYTFSGQLKMSIGYSDINFSDELMQKLMDVYKNTVHDLIDEVLQLETNEALQDKWSLATSKALQETVSWTEGDVVEVSQNQFYHLQSNEKIGINSFIISSYNEGTFEDQLRTFLSKFPFLCVELSKEDDTIMQTLVSKDRMKIRLEHVVMSTSKSENNGIFKKMNSFFTRPFCVEDEGFIRCFVIREDAQSGKAQIHLGIHHGMTDYYTNNVLISAAERYFEGEPLKVSPLSNFNFAASQRELLGSTAGRQQRNYWKELLRGSMKDALPSKEVLHTKQSINQKWMLSGQEFEAITYMSLDLKVQVNALICAVHQQVLATLYEGKRALQGIIVNGREEQSTSNTPDILGVLDNLLPVPLHRFTNRRLEVGDIKLIYATYLEARMNQQIPFEIIRKDLKEISGGDIEAQLGGIYNFQKLNEDFDLDEIETQIEITELTRERLEGIHIKCIQYNNALEINLSCDKELFQDYSKKLALDNLISINLLETTEHN